MTLAVTFNNQDGIVRVDSGTLQFSELNSTSTGGTFNVTAAGAALDLGSGGVYLGAYTGNGAGVVRLSHGNIFGTSTAPGTTLNFTGGGFEWTGGAFGGYRRGHLLTNAGVMTIAGSGPVITYGRITNTGTITHRSAGSPGGHSGRRE